MEPKWFQNELKMQPKLIEIATKMLPKWCPLSFKIVRDRTSFACVFFVVFNVFVWSSPSFPLSLSAVVVVVVLVSLLLHSFLLLLLLFFLFPLSLSRFCACLLFLVLSCCFAFCPSFSLFLKVAPARCRERRAAERGRSTFRLRELSLSFLVSPSFLCLGVASGFLFSYFVFLVRCLRVCFYSF